MDKIKSLLEFLTPIPRWARVVILALIGAVVAYCMTSCGVTRAVVHNGASGTSTEIKITTNNPTTVTASPNVSVVPPLQNSVWLVSLILFSSCASVKSCKKRFVVEAHDYKSVVKRIRHHAELYCDCSVYSDYSIDSVIKMPPVFYLD